MSWVRHAGRPRPAAAQPLRMRATAQGASTCSSGCARARPIHAATAAAATATAAAVRPPAAAAWLRRPPACDGACPPSPCACAPANWRRASPGCMGAHACSPVQHCLRRVGGSLFFPVLAHPPAPPPLSERSLRWTTLETSWRWGPAPTPPYTLPRCRARRWPSRWGRRRARVAALPKARHVLSPQPVGSKAAREAPLARDPS